jgi:glycosyltransferase involved in cell wall biosynthesis
MKPSVSLLMPVYNSLSDFERGNGRNLLSQSIQSLMSQTYTDFELIIFDNLSEDGTFSYCQSWAAQDSRIKLTQDHLRRNPEESIAQLIKMASADFICIVNDDDIWEPRFLEILIGEGLNESSPDVIYCSGRFINMESQLGDSLVNCHFPQYSDESSVNALQNTITYIFYRNPIPISFGLIRQQVAIKLYPERKFDTYRANVDNLFILELLAAHSRIKFVPDELFYYRSKLRIFDGTKEFNLAFKPSIFELFVFLVNHQAKFSQIVAGTLRNNFKGDSLEKALVANFLALMIHVLRMSNLLIEDRIWFPPRDFVAFQKSLRPLRTSIMDHESVSQFVLLEKGYYESACHQEQIPSVPQLHQTFLRTVNQMKSPGPWNSTTAEAIDSILETVESLAFEIKNFDSGRSHYQINASLVTRLKSRFALYYKASYLRYVIGKLSKVASRPLKNTRR